MYMTTDKDKPAHPVDTSALRPTGATPRSRIPRTTLEQWKILATIVHAGSFSQAAEVLAKSQSSISYAMARLQEQVGVELLTLTGRRAELTPHGRTLLAAAGDLLREAERLEQLATYLDQGWEAEVRVVVDVAFPTQALLRALAAFVAFAPDTRVQLREVVLSGAEEALNARSADLVIGTHVPPGFLGNVLTDVNFIAVAHPQHRLHHLKRQPEADDLAREVHVVVRDSGSVAPRDDGWLGARQRWTVGSMATSRAVVNDGLGFAWLPEHVIAADLLEGRLKRLDLAEGQIRRVTLYSILGQDGVPGPATKRLAELIAASV